MNSFMNVYRGAVIGALVLAVLGAAPAVAAIDDGTDVRRAIVHYDDIDLSTAAGQAQLRSRASRAADRLCAFNDVMHDIAMRIRHECRQHALASADVRIAALQDAVGIASTRRRG